MGSLLLLVIQRKLVLLLLLLGLLLLLLLGLLLLLLLFVLLLLLLFLLLLFLLDGPLAAVFPLGASAATAGPGTALVVGGSPCCWNKGFLARFGSVGGPCLLDRSCLLLLSPVLACFQGFPCAPTRVLRPLLHRRVTARRYSGHARPCLFVMVWCVLHPLGVPRERHCLPSCYCVMTRVQ